VRAAIFSSLAERIGGSRVLDLFAGSGSTGLEAFSRGAAFVCWVESDPRALNTLRENAALLCKPEHGSDAVIRVARDDALRFLKRDGDPERHTPADSYDLIFADPPYDSDGAWLAKLLALLAQGRTLKDDGIFVMEQRASTPVPPHDGWTITRDARYGDTRVLFFRKG
jgi:16S rRNA (guanine966-N2)-methyltransferase